MADCFLLAVCRCPEPHCPDIPLEPSEAVLFELSWTKLARGLCAALNLDYKPANLGLLNTRQIGAWPALSARLLRATLAIPTPLAADQLLAGARTIKRSPAN